MLDKHEYKDREIRKGSGSEAWRLMVPKENSEP